MMVVKAKAPAPGCQDICLITGTPVAEVMRNLATCGVEIEERPVKRTGAVGELSVAG